MHIFRCIFIRKVALHNFTFPFAATEIGGRQHCFRPKYLKSCSLLKNTGFFSEIEHDQKKFYTN